MFAKFSVRKPLTIVIAVILIVILGGISFTKMTTDLLPSMDLPYVAVINDLSRRQPRKGGNRRHQALEQALATTSGVEAITSVSSENSSMVLLYTYYLIQPAHDRNERQYRHGGGLF